MHENELHAKPDTTDVDVLIVGAGVSGVSVLIKLAERGVTNALILDKAERIGGTWVANDYPGLRCDVPSELYSLGFAPNPGWARTYSSQDEIRDYIESVAHSFGVVDRIRLRTEMVSAVWDEPARRWRITTADGTEITAKVFVPAAGIIGEAKMPRLPGQETFRGTVFHSGNWNHEHDLTGERVAVVGAGASAIQFLPAIQPAVGKLYSFQRAPSWVLSKPDFAMPRLVSRVFTRFPFVQRMIREAGFRGLEVMYPLMLHPRLLTTIVRPMQRSNMRRAIEDPELRRRLMPDHPFACKRPMLSNDWYPALAKPNVQVVFQGVERLTERGLVTTDGSEYEVDTVIFGTGYTAGDLAVTHIIRNGAGATINEVWNGSPRSYLGLAVHGFPNMFMMLAPNSQCHVQSVMWTSELQAGYVARAVKALLDGRVDRFEVKKSVHDGFVAAIDKRLERMPSQPKYCTTYFSDSTGRNHVVWPEWAFKIKRVLSRFAITDYDIGATT
ncbi:flavin-containing monooxygenase [Rhodococcus daqingensis]|uniref:Flavin-containing monooxygenase n=1 Tax=Rhodococcus daqingensis TaxID=2479363 RepID=A0ABW2RZ37_9NOCA